jgi:manganese/iron transport system permease protein/iron/zinc/copper transport system permease protein
MDLLTEPLSFAFFTRALVAGVVVGVMCGAIGVFVVLRRMSYIGHGLSHSVLGGVAVAAALGFNIYLGAAVATLLSAVLIDRVARREGLHADAAIGIVTTAMFALGIVVVSRGAGARVNTEALLFGNILGVQTVDVAVAGGVATLFAVLLFVFYKPLVFSTFDPAVAAVQGVRAGVMEVLFNLLVAGVIIVSVRVLGVLLIAAAVVIPAAVARLLTRSFGAMIGVAVVVSVAATVTGLYLSFHVNVASGATIVLAEAATFIVVALGTGLATRRELGGARRRARDASPAVPTDAREPLQHVP